MSKLYYTIQLNEIQATKDGDFIKEFKTNLPHAKEIANDLCKSWNSIDWSKIFDNVLAGNVKCSKMHPVRIADDGICEVRIITTFVDGFRLSEKRRNAYWEQMEGQMCDGWGEGVFGLANLIEFSDGSYGYTD